MKKFGFLLLFGFGFMGIMAQPIQRHSYFPLTIGSTDTMYVMSAFTGNSSPLFISFTGKKLSASDAIINLGERPHPDSMIFNAYQNSNLPHTLTDSTVSFLIEKGAHPYLVIKLSPGSCSYGETVDMYVSSDRILPNLPGESSRIKGCVSTTGVQKLINVIGSSSSSSAAGGGGALTGVATYSNASDDFSVEVIDGTKKVYVTGAPYTVNFMHLVGASGKVWNSNTNEISDLITTYASVSNDTITFSGQSSNFTSNDSVVLYLIMPTKAYDIAQDVTNVVVQNQNYAHYTDVEHIVNETGLDGDSTYVVIYMASYKYLQFHAHQADSGYIWIYHTLNDDASDTDETDGWVPLSNTVFDNDTLIGADSSMYVLEPCNSDNTGMPLKYLFKVKSPDDTCAQDIWIRKFY